MRQTKMDKLKIGKTKIFLIIHFCLPITNIFVLWIIVYPVVNEFSFVMQTVALLIIGIGGTGIYINFIPRLREVENDYIILSKRRGK